MGSVDQGARAGSGHQRALIIGALGVVYGDIGTSPIYALRELIAATAGLTGHRQRRARRALADVLGARHRRHDQIRPADHARRQPRRRRHPLARRPRPAPGQEQAGAGASWSASRIIGVALFYGDGLITPAISVLSAVEGLEVVAPELRALRRALRRRHPGRAVHDPVARHGAASAACSARSCASGSRCWRRSASPASSASPTSSGPSTRSTAWSFWRPAAGRRLAILGAVVLTVTGAEALYADMGHFGRPPIKRAWLYLVLPALTLNYFGQGALVLQRPGCGRRPVLPAGAALGAGAARRSSRPSPPSSPRRPSSPAATR